MSFGGMGVAPRDPWRAPDPFAPAAEGWAVPIHLPPVPFDPRALVPADRAVPEEAYWRHFETLAAPALDLGVGLSPLGVVQDVSHGVAGLEAMVAALLQGRAADAVGGAAAGATGLVAAAIPGLSARQIQDGLAQAEREARRILGYHDLPAAGGRHETDRIAAASSRGSDDQARAGVGSADPALRPGAAGGVAARRPDVDPEGRALEAPVVVHRDLTPDEIRFLTLGLNDGIETIDPALLARLAGEAANGLHLMRLLPDGRWTREVYLNATLPPSEAVRVEAHEGIGHGIRSHVSPDALFRSDDLIRAAGTEAEDTTPLAQMMEASFAKRGAPYGTFAEPDENWADFIEALTLRYAQTRAAWPEAARLVRDLWNAHPMARRTVQFYDAAPLLLTPAAAAALIAALDGFGRQEAEERPRSPLLRDGA